MTAAAACLITVAQYKRRHAGSGRGFRRQKAHGQLPTLRTALQAHQVERAVNADLEQQAVAA